MGLTKLTLVIGAAIAGSVLAGNDKGYGVPDLLSGAFKIIKKLKPDDSGSPVSKPRNDYLMAQVNSLREELKLLTSNRSVTVISTGGAGTNKYGTVIIVIVIGYGYIWWKGWKLHDMMFVTRRSLSDAASKIGTQLETVYSSISAAKRHLSSRIDKVDSNLDDCRNISEETKEAVSDLRDGMKDLGVDVSSVHHAVLTLETKINRIEGKQDLTIEGVKSLCNYVWNFENKHIPDQIQSSSSSQNSIRAAPDVPLITSVSLPASLEPPSPSNSNENSSPTARRPPAHSQSTTPLSGLKELKGITEASSESGGSGLGRRIAGVRSFITRTRGVVI